MTPRGRVDEEEVENAYWLKELAAESSTEVDVEKWNIVSDLWTDLLGFRLLGNASSTSIDLLFGVPLSAAALSSSIIRSGIILDSLSRLSREMSAP